MERLIVEIRVATDKEAEQIRTSSFYTRCYYLTIKKGSGEEVGHVVTPNFPVSAIVRTAKEDFKLL